MNNLNNHVTGELVRKCVNGILFLAASGNFRASTLDRKMVNKGMSLRSLSLFISLVASYEKKLGNAIVCRYNLTLSSV